MGWLSPATVLIDEALSEFDVVWAATGHPHAVYTTSYSELIKASGAKPMIVGHEVRLFGISTPLTKIFLKN